MLAPNPPPAMVGGGAAPAPPPLSLETELAGLEARYAALLSSPSPAQSQFQDLLQAIDAKSREVKDALQRLEGLRSRVMAPFGSGLSLSSQAIPVSSGSSSMSLPSIPLPFLGGSSMSLRLEGLLPGSMSRATSAASGGQASAMRRSLSMPPSNALDSLVQAATQVATQVDANFAGSSSSVPSSSSLSLPHQVSQR